MCPGSAGSHNHTVEPLFTDFVGYLLGCIGGTNKKAFLGMSNIVQGRGILNHRGDVYNSSDIGTAVTDKYTYLGFFIRDIPFLWIDSVPGQFSPAVAEEVTGNGSGAAGGDNRFGDIHGSEEGSAGINSRTGS